MALKILQDGYEDTIRNRFGVSEGELPTATIGDKFIADLAEAMVIKRVPLYSTITDPYEKTMLELAAISYVCYLLAPTMSRRLNIEVQTIDVKWKKEKVDWDRLIQQFLTDFEYALSQIESVEIIGIANYPLGGIATFQEDDTA